MSVSPSPANLYLTAEQVAVRYSVSTDTIYRWKRDGNFPSARKLSPGTVRWLLADLQDWEETRVTCFATELGL